VLFCLLGLQSDESIYERECGNMPGFAVYYRYPNSQRVTYGQFVRVSSFSWIFQLFKISFLISTILKNSKVYISSSIHFIRNFLFFLKSSNSLLNPSPLPTQLPSVSLCSMYVETTHLYIY
jgi:hypothetical protein